MSQFHNAFSVRYLTNQISSGSVYPVCGNEQPDTQTINEQTEEEEMCPVCGDKVSGYHYGLLTCESCKGFFKRTVQNKKVYSCVENKKCPIDKSQRKRCPFCRYQKCLKVGMRLDAVRSDRMRGGRNKLGPMYKQDRARKQQLQAFHRATGFLRVIDPCGTIHSALEKSILGSVHDWLQDGKSELEPDDFNTKIGELRAKTAKWWPYAQPQLILPSAESSSLTAAVQRPLSPTRGGVNRAVSAEDSARMQYATTHNIGLQGSLKRNSASTDFMGDCFKTDFNENMNATDAQKREVLQYSTGFVETDISSLCCNSYRCLSDLPRQSHEVIVGHPNKVIHRTSLERLPDKASHFSPVSQTQSLLTRTAHKHVQHDGKLCQTFYRSVSPLNVIQALSMCEINEKDIRTRTVKKVETLPEHGFTFICGVTNAMLLLLVEWAKSSSYFQELKTTDQMILLQNGWVDILVLDHIFRQIAYSDGSIVLPTGHCFAPDVCEGLIDRYCLLSEEAHILHTIMQRFSELKTKLRNLRIDRKEFICLKFLILFNTDASPECKNHLKKTQEMINMALCDYSSNREVSNSGRVGQLLYTLSEIRTLSLLCEDYLLRQHLKGNTPTDTLLMEMFHAKRNVTVR